MLDDAWGAVAELAASQHGVFTRSQAALHQISAKRIRTAQRSGRIVAFGSNVFLVAGHPPGLHRDLAIVTHAQPSAVVSHRAAAVLHGLEGVTGRVAEVLVPRPHRVPLTSSPPVIVHAALVLDPQDVTTVCGLPCTTIARTLADLGAVVDDDTVLKALIGARRSGMSLRWARETAERLHRPGPSGTGTLLRALDQFERAGSAPESWLEEVLRRIIDTPRLPRLVSQYVLRDGGGAFVARFDHAFPEVQLGIEAHSRQFHFGPVRERLDEDRDLRAARCGWDIVYLSSHATRRPREVVDLLLDIVEHRRHRT